MRPQTPLTNADPVLPAGAATHGCSCQPRCCSSCRLPGSRLWLTRRSCRWQCTSGLPRCLRNWTARCRRLGSWAGRYMLVGGLQQHKAVSAAAGIRKVDMDPLHYVQWQPQSHTVAFSMAACRCVFILCRSLVDHLTTHHCSYQWQGCSSTLLTSTAQKHSHPRCRLQHKWRQSWPLHSCWARRRCSRWWLVCMCSWWAHLHAGTIQAGALSMQANTNSSADCAASKHRKTHAQPWLELLLKQEHRKASLYPAQPAPA